jgi:hypothetical protein
MRAKTDLAARHLCLLAGCVGLLGLGPRWRQRVQVIEARFVGKRISHLDAHAEVESRIVIFLKKGVVGANFFLKKKSRQRFEIKTMEVHYGYPYWADAASDSAFDLILLNSDFPALHATSGILRRLWERGTIRLVADGGANNLAMALGTPHVAALRPTDLPTMIAGDLDSLLPDVQAQYAALAVWQLF